MFIANQTMAQVALTRGFVTEEDLAVAVVARCRYAVAGSQQSLVAAELCDSRELPPIFKTPTWGGTSVTASGTVHGPPSPPFERGVELRVGSVVRRLRVCGDRRWSVGAAGQLVPGVARPFEGIRLGFDRAFGGAYDVAPGIDPKTKLPDPGGPVRFQLNPIGVGFYRDARHAEGRPLPNIEDHDEPIRRWDDRPTPAGVSPCPDHHALRLLGCDSGASDADFARLQHHAPPSLIFGDLAAGTELAVLGVGSGPLFFTLPAMPAVVATLPSTRLSPWRVRSVDLDCDASVVDVTSSVEFVCRPEGLPRWIYVTPTNRG
jgi:hypothetical protein